MSNEAMLSDLVEAKRFGRVDFNYFEKGFIGSMVEWVGDGRELTDRQAEKLEEIWEKRVGHG